MRSGPGRSASARTRLILIAIAVLAVVLRVATIVFTHATHAPAEENRIIARNLAAGRGFTFTEFTVTGPTAIRGPVYPMLLAIVGPNRMGLILAINVIAGAATVFAAYALTSRLLSPFPDFRGRESDPADSKSSIGLIIAAALFAFWPTQLYAATLTQGLSLAVLLTLASLAFAVRRTPVSLITAGLLAGLAALTEPVLALPLLLCAIVLGWRDRRRLCHWRDAAVFVLTAMVLIAPWLYRNAIVFGRPMPITSNFWRDVYLGNGPSVTIRNHDTEAHVDAAGRASRKSLSPIERLPPNQFDQLKVPEPKRIQVFAAWAIQQIKSDPWHYFRLSLSRLFDARDESDSLHRNWLGALRILIWGFTLSVVWNCYRRRADRIMVLVLAILIGIAGLTVVSRFAARNVIFEEMAVILLVASNAIEVTANQPQIRRRIGV